MLHHLNTDEGIPCSDVSEPISGYTDPKGLATAGLARAFSSEVHCGLAGQGRAGSFTELTVTLLLSHYYSLGDEDYQVILLTSPRVFLSTTEECSGPINKHSFLYLVIFRIAGIISIRKYLASYVHLLLMADTTAFLVPHILTCYTHVHNTSPSIYPALCWPSASSWVSFILSTKSSKGKRI